MHFIDVPEEAAHPFISSNPIRLLCLLNEKVEFHCALRPKGNGSYYISVGTPIRQHLKLRQGDKIQAAIWKDDSEFGRKMPEELRELLAIDEEGNHCFQALKPSEQRGILYYVDGAKNSQIRVDRAIKMIDRLKKK